ncbi:hypothetical protein FKM82_017128 [Ascaphus truei]
MGLSSSHHSLDNTDFDNKDDDKHDQRLLSQFGIWFLVSLCTPSENTPTESLARLVSMVFQWFHSTAYMMDDEVGSLVEKLKPQFVSKWLKTVCDIRFDVMVMCLLPKPMEFARVGGYWDKSCSAVTQLKEGLNRILCLIPYNVINQPVWECIMPEWLEAIRTEVPDIQLKEFREVLSKMFDIELCPLPFSMEEMFGFISCRFTGYPSSVQEQALLWLHEPTDNLEDSLLFSRVEFIIGTEGEQEEIRANKQNPGNHTGPTDPTNTTIKNDTDRKFCYQQLPVTLKLIYTILQEMAKFDEPDILFNMLNCLKILCLHGECLYIAKKDHLPFLAYIQEHMLISSLWRVLKSEFSQLSSLGVPLLLHALSLPHGADIFWMIINSNFNSKDWQMRFEAVEKVAVLCRFLDIHSVTKNHLLKYSLAHAFCCFLTAVEDVNPAVATRAGLLLDTIKRPALQGLCVCLDFQFDTVVKDRPTILSKLLLLHFIKQDIPALSWEFFVNRFDTLSLEAQLHLDCNKEFPFPTTITAVRTNVANLSDAALWKIKRARFARNRQKSVRSLRDSVKGTGESKRALSLPETLSTKIPVRLTRHEQSAPVLGGVAEQTQGQHSPENDNIIKDPLPEDAGIDHQTVHQLITVLMKFMAKDKSSAEADISSAKAFNTVKRHLYVLLGHDQQEGCFMIAPQKMRTSTCFNAFIAGIAQVMDYNINLGKHLLPLVVQVLKYCTCPQLRHYFQHPPRCSLWSLKPHIRQMWLKALLVILYKYPYRESDLSKIVLHLIHITVNTLNAQYHSCKPHATAGPLYSDNSNISRYSEKEKEEDSVFDESDIHDTPTVACNKDSQTFFARLKRIGGSKMVKYQPVEMNAQRSEIELAEYRESGALQDTILRCVREESIHKKKLRSLKQKSLDIGNTDSLLFTLDEHRRKSCIERCEIVRPITHKLNDYDRPQQNSSTMAEPADTNDNVSARERFHDARRPLIPEVRLSCMETFEMKVDSPAKPSPREDLDLIDLSSDSTSGPEKQSILSTSDSDSLVFEPLPPLRIVESDDEEFQIMNNGNIVVSTSSTPIRGSILSLSMMPLVQVSIEDCSKDFTAKDLSRNPALQTEDISPQTPEDQKDFEELAKPDEIQEVSSGSPLTLKQKRDQLRKSCALPEMSLDDNIEDTMEESKSGVKSVLLKVPEDTENQTDSDKPDASTESDTEQNVDLKEEAEESEFKIHIVPRQRKQRKIAVSAIQREYLDITFNIIDKLGEQKDTETESKGLSILEMPRESASAPTLEAGVPETSSRSSLTTQYRQMKRGSLGAVTMTQIMKRQLEHQSSAPHNISTWDPDDPKTTHEVLGSISEVSMGRTSIPYIQIGATKSSLLSAPSIVSMFVPAPEDFSDDQPTVMTDKCHDCGAILEEYDEETLGLAIVVLLTFIHLSPDLAAPLLLDVMQSVGRLASSTSFSHHGLNNKKNLPAGGAMLRCLENISTFMEALPMDSPSNLWTTICNQFQTFFTKLPSVLPLKCCLDSSLRIMICLLKIPTSNATRVCEKGP